MLKKSPFIIVCVTLLLTATYYFNKRIYKPYTRKRQAKDIVNKLTQENDLGDYDIIFQTSLSPQSKEIQLATHSDYSHCGIIHWDGNHCSVWEACNGVSVTPVEVFIGRGKGEHFVIKRLKNTNGILNRDAEDKMDKAFNRYLGKPYDLYFGWGDDKLYCSELVWKVYNQATGIELGKLHKLRDFDLSNPLVQQKMKQRYGNNIPMNEKVISPADIFNSNELITIKQM